MDEGSVSVEVELSTWDVFRVSLARLRFILLGAVVVTGVGLLAIAFGPGPTRLSTVLYTLLPVVLVGAVAIVAWHQATLQAASAAGAPTTFVIGADGLSVERQGRRAKTAWDKLDHFTENRRTFMVYSTPKLAYILPKRCVPPADVARLSTLLGAHLADHSPHFDTIALRRRMLWIWLVLGLAGIIAYVYFARPHR